MSLKPTPRLPASEDAPRKLGEFLDLHVPLDRDCSLVGLTPAPEQVAFDILADSAPRSLSRREQLLDIAQESAWGEDEAA